MEIYSPKKFRNGPQGIRNELVSKPEKGEEKLRQRRRETAAEAREGDAESVGDWMKRVFYDRMKAFFEYEEVS